MTERQVVLLDAAIATLRTMGCRCEHNVPYAGCKVPQVVTRECTRCRCIREFDESKRVAA
jgi:hypothetical protein